MYCRRLKVTFDKEKKTSRCFQTFWLIPHKSDVRLHVSIVLNVLCREKNTLATYQCQLNAKLCPFLVSTIFANDTKKKADRRRAIHISRYIFYSLKTFERNIYTRWERKKKKDMPSSWEDLTIVHKVCYAYICTFARVCTRSLLLARHANCHVCYTMIHVEACA